MMLQNPEFLIIIPLLIYPLILTIRKTGYAKKITGLRALTISLLILAAASPAITQTIDATTEQKLNILTDNTTSMQAIETPEIPVQGTKKVFIDGNNSQIYSQAGQNLQSNSENLLITDGQTKQDTQQLIQEANAQNASVSVYKLEDKNENSVWIEGPSNTVPEATNNYTIKTSSTKNQSVPATITLDGEQIFQGNINQSYSFTKKFNSKGQHTIQVNITSPDIFPKNNQHYKTVKVQEKPEILTIGSRGGLEQELSQFYNIETRQTVPENLEQYYAVILKKPVESQELETYLAEGNGLTYTGPLNEQIPGYLPVRKSTDNEEDAGARIVVALDASFGTGQCENEVGEQGLCTEVSSEGGAAKESIQIAYALVDTLNQNNKVGVVAYNRDSYLISRPESLSTSRERIKNDISRITPEGPSFHDQGLKAANRFVDENDTIVMITDGKIGDYERNRNVPQTLRETSSNMQPKLITVGVGEGTNQPLLEEIAENTNGYYLENNEAGRLDFEFGAGGGETEYTPLAVIKSNHFITQGVELEGSTNNFDNVETRRPADKLAAGANGKPFLSTWRYGLGRVATFSAGNQNLDRIAKSDPEIISRTVSWTVGNPQRKKDNWTNVEDTRMPENPVAESSTQLNGLTQETANLYTAELPVPEQGFNQWRNQKYAYNYNSEKQRIGQNMEKLQSIPQQTGGIIYDSENIDELPNKLSQINKKIERNISLSPYIVALAILTFLAEIGFRKRKGRL